MVMGFIVRGERYSLAQCISAIFLAIGASLFFLENKRNAVTEGMTFSVLILRMMTKIEEVYLF